MPTPQMLSETLLEGTTGIYSFELVDEEGEGIDSSFLTTLTLTLYDVDTHQVVNTRSNQDILNANNGTVETTPGSPVTTTVTFNIQPEDTPILNQNRLKEARVLSFRWTWDSGQRIGRHEVQFNVENVMMTPA
jgi:hypothetical protein